MSTYNLNIDTVNSSLAYFQAEKYNLSRLLGIYGSSRLGMLKDSVNVLGSAFGNSDTTNITHTLGNKRYELTNHLGNVLSVISDKPIPHDDGSGNADYWQADILSSYDYSPFGVMLTGRTFEKIDSVPVTTTEIVPIAKDSVMVSVEDYIHYTDFEEAVHTTSSALPVTYTNYHGWTNWSNSTLSTEYRSGSNWLKINSTVGSGGANKYLLLQPSTQYRLTFTADRASVANFVVVAATISSTNSLNIFATQTVSTNGAQTFTFTTPASLPMNVVMLQLRQSGTYYIDNYSVTKVSSSEVIDFGNFEYGAYASNTVMDYYDDWYNRANLPIAIAQGNWMNRIRVNYGDPYDCLRKVISVTPNQQYTFRGKVVGAQNGNVRVMQKNTGTSTLYLVTYQLISTNDGYVEFNFTPTMNEVQVTVNGVGTYYLEDVAVFKTITQKKYTPTTHEQVLPTFTNVQNMTQTGATVQSTSGSGSKGGESVQQINKGDYVQFEIGSDALSNYYSTSVGISYTPSGKNIEMDFSWYLGLPAMTRDVLVAGVYKPNLNNPRLFQNGDVYRIWRNNGNVEFYVNGLLDGTFPDKYPDRPMYLEAVFYDVNKKVENLYIYKEVLKTHDTIQTTEMVAKVDGYKRGFQGQLRDDEIKNRGNSYDFGARLQDPRLGRWLTIDPLFAKYPDLSPYNFTLNNPIYFVDPDGKDGIASVRQAEPIIKKSGKVIEGGTLKNPHEMTIKANYYYNAGTISKIGGTTALSSAIDAYNSSNYVVKGADGQYYKVSFEISPIPVNEISHLDIYRNHVDADNVQGLPLGNLIATDIPRFNDQLDKDELGAASARSINLKTSNVKDAVSQGANMEITLFNMFLHEIGHNLGGAHEDGGAMNQNVVNEQTNTGGINTASDYVLPAIKYSTEKNRLTKDNVQAIVNTVWEEGHKGGRPGQVKQIK